MQNTYENCHIYTVVKNKFIREWMIHMSKNIYCINDSKIMEKAWQQRFQNHKKYLDSKLQIIGNLTLWQT